jgi:hypothetical protein
MSQSAYLSFALSRNRMQALLQTRRATTAEFGMTSSR